LETLTIRILVVEDSEPFRKFICATLGRPEFQIVEVTDGLEAVRNAEELQPDLVLLDIGLPSLNGIEAARRIRKLASERKILFLSQESSFDVVQAALGTGAQGYIVKTDAGSELLDGVDAVLAGEQFVGRRLAGHDFVSASGAVPAKRLQRNGSHSQLQRNKEIVHSHRVGFYSADAKLLDDVTEFVGAALEAGSATIVIATESHQSSLLLAMQARGLDMGAAIEQGRYVTLDAIEALSTFMLNGMPDSFLFLKILGSLIATATANGRQGRVAIFGECVHLLWAQGNAEAAIQVEKLANQLAKKYSVDILCAYSLDSVEGGMDSHILREICAEHSAVCSG
jgi:DNA-binding response OmpR family regulator